MGSGYCKSYCVTELRMAREEMAKPEHKAFRERIAGMYVNTSTGWNDPYHWTHAGDGTKLWEGTACCKYQARIKAIDRYFRQYDQGHRYSAGDDLETFFNLN